MNKLLLETQALRYRYGDTLALDGLDLSLEAGRVIALLGPNGAGKTTLIHLLLGLLPVRDGRLQVLGAQPGTLASKQRIGAMLQISGVQDNLTVAELLDLFGSFYPQPAAAGAVLEEAGLEGLEQRQFRHLSGGQQKRVLYALAIIGNPALLVLDEPTTGMDPAARRQLWHAIDQRRAAGGSVLLCTHYLDEAEQLADHIVVLNRGRLLFEGSSDAVRQQVPRRQIKCRSNVDVRDVEGLPGVQQVARNQDSLDILAAEAEPVLRFLLAQDPGLSEVEVTRSSLEDAFLTLTTDSQTGALVP